MILDVVMHYIQCVMIILRYICSVYVYIHNTYVIYTYTGQNDPCNQYETCNDCIAGFDCVWCPDTPVNILYVYTI